MHNARETKRPNDQENEMAVAIYLPLTQGEPKRQKADMLLWLMFSRNESTAHKTNLTWSAKLLMLSVTTKSGTVSLSLLPFTNGMAKKPPAFTTGRANVELNKTKNNLFQNYVSFLFWPKIF